MLVKRVAVFKPDKDIIIDYNYNYEMTKNIYLYLNSADKIKNKFIHNEGYRTNSGHVFKLFNFTLLFKNAVFDKDYISCNNTTLIKLIINGEESIVNLILKGLLQVRNLQLFNNKIPLLKFENDRKTINFKNIMLYKAVSPIVQTTRNDVGNIEFLTPYNGEYYKNLANNAKRKYELIYDKDYKGEIYFDIDNALDIRAKSVAFKGGWIRGFLFDVWVEANKDMQEIIYYLGLGQNSSTGFGSLKIISGGD